MEKIDYWHFCDELSVIQATLLIVGEDPAVSQDYIDTQDAQHRPDGYDAVFAALKNAINGKSLAATLRHDARYGGYDEYPNTGESVRENEYQLRIIFVSEPNWHLTTVTVENLKKWLISRGCKTGFFFESDLGASEFFDPNNLFYAPKLAAAVNAWGSVTKDETLLSGKTPKKALEKWLRENASQYGLTKDDGNPNETGIEEICKIANWKPEGGAAKTPTLVVNNPPTQKKPKKSGQSEETEKSSTPF